MAKGLTVETMTPQKYQEIENQAVEALERACRAFHELKMTQHKGDVRGKENYQQYGIFRVLDRMPEDWVLEGLKVHETIKGWPKMFCVQSNREMHGGK